jgi:2-polyprenyl-3-methyl-5-hydroxy-6-metoxy-1,4-benzoquinol methylase
MIEPQSTLGSSQQHFGKTYGGAAPENYERYFVPAIGAPFAADLIESTGLTTGDHVLDVACGTGSLLAWRHRASDPPEQSPGWI